ncbi:hypothetical protein ACFQXA_23670 [Nocardiopsis composta]
MHSLDPKTLRRLAEVIVDIGGPYERKGWELEELLQAAAWPGEPEYDGEPRVVWLLEEMTDRCDDHAAIERLLCRVCDPLEYEEGAGAADAVRETVNEKLRPEGLAISQAGGRPVVGRLGAGGAVHMSEPLTWKSVFGRSSRTRKRRKYSSTALRRPVSARAMAPTPLRSSALAASWKGCC